MNNAYMIRSDGKAFPVTVHLYANPDVNEIEETLGASEWLYSHTADPSTKTLIADLWASYAKYLDPDVTLQEMADTLKYHLKRLPYHVVTPAFIDSLNFGNAHIYAELSGINLAVNDALNQEFLRARYGGMYDTSSGSNSMYFRTSSVGFNWFPIIWDFVYSNRNQISDVTIVKDPESTGVEGAYYSHAGVKIDHLDVNDFINLSGRPVFDSYWSIASLYPNMPMARRHVKILYSHVKDSRFVKGPEFSR